MLLGAAAGTELENYSHELSHENESEKGEPSEDSHLSQLIASALAGAKFASDPKFLFSNEIFKFL